MVKLKLQLFAYSGSSIVDYLNSEGKDSSFSARKQLAADVGITNYTGTASQNQQLLNSLMSGASSATNTTNNTNTTTNTDTTNNTTTNTTTTTTPTRKVNGVDDATLDKAYNSTFTASDKVNAWEEKTNSAISKMEGIASDTSIVDKKTMNTINSSFSASKSYTEAMKYTNELLEKLSSGRTSYTDQVESMMNKILNREDFEYDVDSDQLFQQALASAMNSGKTAMQDTIGQASALTGGYGSTYATSAGNQAYNAYIEDAYNNLPEYYQMALQAYQMEGEEMYNQLGMFVDADNREYQRTYDAWNANFANAESMYNREYGQWQDSVNNAFNSANLQINERNTLFGEATSLVDAYSNQYTNQYNREYQKWADEVTQAQQYASMLNNDWWANTNFNESVRQFNENLAENARQFDASLAEDKRQFNETMAYNKSRGSSGGGGGSGSGSGTGTKSPTETQMKKALEAYNEGGSAGYAKYVDSLPSNVDTSIIASYVANYGELPLDQRTYTKTEDTFNWLWGNDNDDIVQDQYGNTYRIDELPDSIRKDLTGLKQGQTWN